MKAKAVLIVLSVVVAASVLTGCTFRIPLFISPPIVGEWSRSEVVLGVTTTRIMEFHLDMKFVFTEKAVGSVGGVDVSGENTSEGTYSYDRCAKELTTTLDGHTATVTCEFVGILQDTLIVDDGNSTQVYKRKALAWLLG